MNLDDSVADRPSQLMQVVIVLIITEQELTSCSTSSAIPLVAAAGIR